MSGNGICKISASGYLSIKGITFKFLILFQDFKNLMNYLCKITCILNYDTYQA